MASNYLEENIGTHLLLTSSWTKPSNIYVALFLTMPAEDGTGAVEVSGTGYARIACGPGDSYWTTPVSGSGSYTNAVVVQYGSPGADWGSVVGFGLFDAITSGNYLTGNIFSAPVSILSGNPPPAFAIGALNVTIS